MHKLWVKSMLDVVKERPRSRRGRRASGGGPYGGEKGEQEMRSAHAETCRLLAFTLSKTGSYRKVLTEKYMIDWNTRESLQVLRGRQKTVGGQGWRQPYYMLQEKRWEWLGEVVGSRQTLDYFGDEADKMCLLTDYGGWWWRRKGQGGFHSNCHYPAH